MKTTVDLPDALLAEVREVAERRGWMVKTVFEESLRRFLDNSAEKAPPEPFKLRHTVVQGESWPDMSFAEMLEMTNPSRWKPEAR